LREIHLTRGMVALVDDEDYAYLAQWNWYYSGGYAKTLDRVNKTGKVIAMHRLLLEAKPGEIVDHANRNKLDNRRINLRMSNLVGNARNRDKYDTEMLSVFKGVTYSKKRRKYVSNITVEKGKTIYLGHYLLEKDAAFYYNEYAKEYFREFAVLNDLGDGYTPSEPFSPGEHKNKTSSKYVGVSRRKTDGKYRAYIVKDYKQISIGIFATERIAAEMYNAAAVELHGDKAKLNIFEQTEGIING
jgi:AP2 domain